MSRQPKVFDNNANSLANESDMLFIHDPAETSILEEDDSNREDIYGRLLKLCGSIFACNHATGVVIAIRGSLSIDKNCFVVQDFCTKRADPEPILGSIENMSVTSSTDKFVCLISDLGFAANRSADQKDLIGKFLSFVSGLHEDIRLKLLSSRIVHVIIAGNLLSNTATAEDMVTACREGFDSDQIDGLQLVDSFLSSLGSEVHVDVMPGPNELSLSTLMPQQPMNRELFPLTNNLESVRFVLNPHSMSIDNRSILGTSGQNIKSIMDTTTGKTECEAMNYTLNISHMFPTAPDYEPCLKFKGCDPFIISEAPNVYFVGNQKSFSRKISEDQGFRTLLVSVPSLVQTRSIVLVGLSNLRCMNIIFDPDKVK